MRPLLEVRVALHDELLVGIERGEVVGPGAGDRLGACVPRRAVGRDDRGVRDGDPVLELGVRSDEVDRHGPLLVVRDHATFERARRGLLQAGGGADDAGVEGARRRALHLEDAPERRDDVVRRHLLAVRELDPLADLEDPFLTAVRRGRQVCGDIRHDGEGCVAARFREAEQPVVGRLVQLPVLECVVDLGVERSACRLRLELQRPTPVCLHERRSSGSRGRACPGRRCAARISRRGRQRGDHGSSDENRWYPPHIVS